MVRKKTVAYYRSSTLLQENSVDMQKRRALKCAIKHLLVIDEHFEEPAVSARKNKLKDRTEMDRLMEEIKADRIENLLVYKRDRLARDATEYMELYHLFKAHNVNIIFTADNEFPIQYSPIGDFFELIMGGLVQHEGEVILERILATRISKFEEGKHLGNLPYGYKADDDHEDIEKVESELAIVRRIYDEVLNGTDSEGMPHQTMNGVLKTLLNARVLGDDRNWTVQYVTHLCQNELYKGVQAIKFKKSTEPGRFPRRHLAIISEPEWDRAQERVEELTVRREKKIKVEIPFILDKLVYCAACGQPLIGKVRQRDDESVGFYECETDKDVRVATREVELLVRKRAQELFSQLLKTHLGGLLGRYQNEQIKKLQTMLDQQRKIVSDKTKRLMNLTERWVNETDEDAKAKMELKLFEKRVALEEEHRIEQELVKLQRDISELSRKPRAFIANLESFYQKMEAGAFGDLQVFMQDIVSRVTVSRFYIDIVFKHPFVSSIEVMDSLAE